MADAKEIAEFLNKELKIHDIEDTCCNGLQVENEGEITKIGFAVDAGVDTFEKAKESGCHMIIVHHGMIWEGIKYIKGDTYKRVSILIKNNIALYAAHLPLDRHEEYGNNIQLSRILGLQNLKPFGYHSGKTIGFMGEVNLTREEIKQKLSEKGMQNNCFCHGKEDVKKVAIISGGGKGEVYQAILANVDLFITGEIAYRYPQLAKENEFNIICAGHYATETWGVKALMPLLKEKFNVDVEFIDNPIDI
jgi:dinuclear metal center YbgI/SA1388 family protein